ncbi:MAG: serine dehydratase subunit alpha family protein, partial [Ellagibacter isourolithinifaciens]|nr:serine dehydratase subunit alpha family protein [Ellagibacter isourolithinifaciens]
MNERTYKAYVQILEDELIVATGCTEPIAIAFASAKAAQVLGSEPERISISVSGNIIKNVHSVTVPNTGGQHGVKTAVAAGIAAGDADKGLDVLSGLNDDGRAYMARYLEEHEIRVEFADTSEPFYIDVRVFGDNGGSARVVMAKNHTNVVLVERDGEILQDTRTDDPSDGENALTELLNVADIIEFADTVDLADVEEVLSRQADYNYAISCE